MDRLDLQVVIVYAGVYSKTIRIVLKVKVRDVWEWLNFMHVGTGEG